MVIVVMVLGYMILLLLLFVWLIEDPTKVHAHELFYLLVVQVDALPQVVRVVVVNIDHMIGLPGDLLVVEVRAVILLLHVVIEGVRVLT